MKTFIGIDLGTSGLKMLLVDEKGTILKSASRDYPLMFPKSGWAEQNPEDWWNAVRDGLAELLSDQDKAAVSGIGVAGQMHGLVILDENDKVIRPAILWNDIRTDKETEYLNEIIGKDKLSEYTANIAFAGFTAPKLLWLKKNEPENFGRIKKIMLPKDYITFKLTGNHVCDMSDASGLLLLDVKNRCYSKEMLKICDITEDQLPKLYESYEVVGNVIADLGLSMDVKVVAGAGDNAGAAVGTGTVGDGRCNISIGTSGTIFISSEKFGVDSFNALHSFAHADGYYHLMGVALCAAACNQWFCKNIIGSDDYNELQSHVTDDMLGKNSIFFLPYLMGERSPINDTDARGTFIGMSMDTSKYDMMLAVLEGVAFGIRDSFEIAKSLGIDIKRSNLVGGGAKSPLWRRIIANVLNIPIDLPVSEEGPSYGGAMLAMVGCGLYKDVKSCAEALVSVRDTVYPDKELAALYEGRYQKFKSVYPSLKNTFKILAGR